MSVVFNRLALGGGGVKGVLHIGALQELSKHQQLVFPNGVYGSSIGSIIASYVAFGLPIDNAIPLMKKYLKFERIVPKPSFIELADSLSSKGIFSMNLFESTLKEMFLEAGIDISDKKLNDAKMPLYIITSNISKRTPSILSGNVPLLDALRCSCCIPGIFKPQVLYGQLYIDGDTFSPCLSGIVPINSETLVLSLLKQSADSMRSNNIDKISPVDYVQNIYLSIMIQLYNAQSRPGILHLKYPGLYSTSDLDDLDIDKILEYSASELRTFRAQCANQESPEGSNTRLS
jgi:hypothetical protein